MRARRALDARILALAVPAAGSAILQVVHRAVDMLWVSRLGTDALAGLSVSSIAVWMYAALGALVAIGLTALVARYAGAGRPEAAGYVAGQGLLWAVVLGVAFGAVGWLLTPLLFVAAAAAPEAAAAGEAYTRVFWTGGGAVLLQQAADAVFRGHGNTRVPFLAAVLALLLNVGLDPLLIFGWGPIPALGVAGAAWATLLATAVAAGLLVHLLARVGHLRRERPDDAGMRLAPGTRLGRPGRLGLDVTVFYRVARVGLPVAGASLLFNGIYLVLYRIVEHAGGAAAQAGLGLGHTGEGIAYVLGLGWSAAAAAIVGQSLGAGRPRRAARAAWRATAQCALLCALWGVILFVFAEEIAHALTALHPDADAAARAHAASYFRIVALCLAPQAMEIVLDGAFGGAGLTLPPMVISTTFSLMRLPLAVLAAFGLGLGVAGVWWTIAATAAARGLVAAWWFSRGTWKTRQV